MAAPPHRSPSALPHVVKSPHGDRVDEYYWMRDDDPKAKRPEIIEHLKAENAYTEAMLAHVKPLQDRLVAEMRARIKEDDSSVPVYDNGYWYWRRFDAGAEYPILLRQRGGPAAPDAVRPEEVVLDIPQLARPHAYYNVGATAVSPGQPLAGLRRGHRRPPHLHAALPQPRYRRTRGGVDHRRAGRRRVGRRTARRCSTCARIRRRWCAAPCTGIGSAPTRPVTSLVYDEPDPELFTGIARSASRRYLMIQLEGYDTTETRVVPLAAPATRPDRRAAAAQGRAHVRRSSRRSLDPAHQRCCAEFPPGGGAGERTRRPRTLARHRAGARRRRGRRLRAVRARDRRSRSGSRRTAEYACCPPTAARPSRSLPTSRRSR